jgi:hypothetical protein
MAPPYTSPPTDMHLQYWKELKLKREFEEFNPILFSTIKSAGHQVVL